jgi:1,4-dihydroxy-6-naphthoate synthase
MTTVQNQPKAISVAVSPCPNDTAIFGSWILGQGQQLPALRASFVWADVEELNIAAAQGRYAVVKVSAAQALRLRENYAILSSGGAFGLSHGPKLVAREIETSPRVIAVPGLHTTAVILLQRDWEVAELVPMRYDLIVNAVLTAQVDAGLLIHESALLLEQYKLHCLLDLGRWWAKWTGGLPLPLGCILGRRSLGKALLGAVEWQIRASLDHFHARPEAVRPLIKALAREIDDAVLDAHIRAYVNDFSRDMGQRGQEALAALEECIRFAR